MTLNERALRRISADLHDGPGQTVSLALIRFDALRRPRRSRRHGAAAELDEVETALRDALRDMRTIAAGLRMPELAPLPVRDVVERAVSDHTRQTGMAVAVTIGSVPEQVGLSTKIALFRATQELLSNAFRHGNGTADRLHLESDRQFLQLTVKDGGPGFDVADRSRRGGPGTGRHAEQAELLGGDFEILSKPGSGTETRVRCR